MEKKKVECKLICAEEYKIRLQRTIFLFDIVKTYSFEKHTKPEKSNRLLDSIQNYFWDEISPSNPIL